MEAFQLLALIPFAFFCLLLLFRPSASLLKISITTLVVTGVIAFLFWSLPLSIAGYSLGRGVFIALDILFIIFGAILFLEILRLTNVTASLAFYLDNFSPDLRVQVIMLAWFLENFIEGIAGFGAPATIVAPLLLTLGLSPVQAVTIALLGNSIAGPFGAVGTPIRVGFSAIPIDQLSVASATAIYNYVGIFIPVFMLWILVSNKPNRFQLFREGLFFALWCGIAFVVPAFLVTLFGIEFPTILGSIIGIALVAVSARFGLFLPSHIHRHSGIKVRSPLPFLKTILPYALFIFILILAKSLLKNLLLPIPLLKTSFNFFNPGIVLLASALIISLYSSVKKRDLFASFRLAFGKSLEPFFVIVAMSTVVQLMNNTADPALGLPSMTTIIASIFTTSLLPVIAPFVGAFGSFITGSATLSNIMFAPSLFSSATVLGQNPVKILSLALTGAGVGNIVALSDVLVAKTVASPHIHLRTLISKLLPYVLICLILVAILGLAF